MANLFELPERPTVPIVGQDRAFPIRRIYCIGRNYAAHAAEMGLSPEREAPFYFTKFADDAVIGGGTIPFPSGTRNYQFETELVVAIGKEAANVSEADALDHVYGYAVGLDMTRRDLQLAAREKGMPWDVGKNFAHSAPIAAISTVADVGHIGEGSIQLLVNGQTKQRSDISKLLWSCSELISFLSRYDRLLPGDLIFTGTPEGVAPLQPGDVLEASIDKLQPLVVTIGELEEAYR